MHVLIELWKEMNIAESTYNPDGMIAIAMNRKMVKF